MKRLFYAMMLLMMMGYFFYPFSAFAKDWKGIVPGVTKRAQVIEKFGPPTRDLPAKGEWTKGILYQGSQKIEGTKQVQLYFDEAETAGVIFVFPGIDIKKEQIVATYGSAFEEKLNDSFKTYLHYKKDGLVVYLKEGNAVVSSLTFQKAEP